MSTRSFLNAGNAAFLDAIYSDYLADPNSVDEQWRNYFAALPTEPTGAAPTPVAGTKPDAAYISTIFAEQTKVLHLINANRYRGHREADIDPLKLYERPPVPDLHPAHYGFGEADLSRTFNTGTLFMPAEAPLGEIYDLLRATYQGTIGVELTHLGSTEQKRWVQERLETARGRPSYSAEKKRDILGWTIAARKLEEYLHKRYVGQKRFSLEGGEALIPMLDDVVQSAGAQGVKELIIGMAHRGRLNVLVNILGKHPEVLFGEFEGKVGDGSGSGDVKYHLGFSSNVRTPGGPIHLVLSFNPSHLEIINPVVEGSARSRQERRGDRGGDQVLPVLIHGDAAFSGQGVVTETLNLSETRGYRTGGTLHVVINNQIGFTTSDPLDSRSTLYCTDVAKLVQAPIFHVNGNDPEAVVFITQLALDFRMHFNTDVVVDIVCYRRWGHNEADEPFATQPMMYQKIRNLAPPQQVYADQLIAEGIVSNDQVEDIGRRYVERLEANDPVSRELVPDADPTHLADWTPYLNGDWREPVSSAISIAAVERLGLKCCEHPDDFEINRAVARILSARRKMARGEQAMDWGFAEILAYAALLEHGYSVRLSGEDCQRGTFFHRHAVLHNQKARGNWTPLAHLFEGQPRLRIINSMLSEEAVLGFEYGYSSSEPECLTIWEAQFGDFVNGAQVVIDQFLSSSEAKWNRFCGLVMLCPHGYDGQGPEHSSARLERYLQLCAEGNMQVCVPTSPAQIFHLLCRQMLRHYRKPLIVMSPKSLLRHRAAVSTREEISEGQFQPVIDEVDDIDPATVSRIVLCSGKVYYDLVEKRREAQLGHVAIARLEQIYPFPETEIRALLARYPKANDICWTQEEPRNQGAWFFMLSRRHLAGCIAKRHRLHYAGRDYSASPAAGYHNVHLAEQQALVSAALAVDEARPARRKRA